jgi:hypothetical protein
MADTHSHDAQLHQHEHTHVTQELRHGQQWEHMDTSPDTSTTTPPSAIAPGAGQRRLVLRIGPVIGGCVAVVPSPKPRRVRVDLGSWLLRHGLGSRRAETTQSDYGRHLGLVCMIVVFVPHAAG